MKNALGLIETVGMAAAIEAADAAVKSANVSLIGVELTKGDGMVTVKIEGDVGAVKAAVDAAKQAALKVNKVYAVKVIPRPAEGLDALVFSKETKGCPKIEAAPPVVVAATEAVVEKDLVSRDCPAEAPTETTEAVPADAPVQTGVNEGPDGTREGLCNYCQDPACPRRKGDPRDWCLHHNA